MFKYSIVVPVYQVEKYIAECIEHVLAQSYKNYELILVDNGATDSSGHICDSYQGKDSRVFVIHLKSNVGISKARNIGIQHASGDYVLFLDSDDFYCDIDFLNMVDQRLSISKAEVLCYPNKKFYENKALFQKEKEAYDLEKLCGSPVQEGWKYLLENNKFDISAWSKVVSTEFIKEEKIFFEEGLIGEDLDWTFQLINSVHSIDGIEKCCYAYRIRNNSTASIHKSAKGCIDLCNIISKWAGYIEQNQIDSRLVQDLKGYLAYQYYIALAMFYHIPAEQKEDAMVKIRDTAWITDYAVGKKAKMCRLLQKVIGINASALLLGFYTDHILNKII